MLVERMRKMTLNFLPRNQKTRTPKLCECGCELMHTGRGKYATDLCRQKAYKAANPEKVKASQTYKRKAENAAKKSEKRDWKSAILACRASDGSCRYGRKVVE